MVGPAQAVLGSNPPPPPPATLFAQVERLDTVDVDGSTNSVAATQTFPSAPPCAQGPAESGCRDWQFSMFNSSSTPLNGAQVAVDTTASASPLNLADPSQFGFAYSPSNFPGSTPCPAPAPTQNQETCPASPGGSPV